MVVGAVLLLATPQLLTFALIPLERLLIGLLLAVEEVLAAVLLGSARLVGMHWSGLGWVAPLGCKVCAARVWHGPAALKC